ncbi:MAG TPA: DUF4352 domain-containing protein [Chloroflexi bacterium]|nr:DUF4352 domain-containing protein [Chloroflexota bacterium]
MTQYWGPPDYPPPPRPQYQLPEPDPELDYYEPEPEGDPPGKRALFFLAGGCTTLILVGCCVVTLTLGWIIDERLGITAPVGQETYIPVQSGGVAVTPVVPQPAVTPPVVTPAPPVTTDAVAPTPPVVIVATPSDSYVIGQPIVEPNLSTELTVLDIQRNVQPNNLAPASGMEFVAVSVLLRSVQPTDFAKVYEVANFQLKNTQDVFYLPDAQADNGRRLVNGELPNEGAVEGDLLFHIPAGEAPLFLVWQATGSNTPYTILLQ